MIMEQNYQFVHNVSDAEAKYVVDPRRLDTEQRKQKSKKGKEKNSKQKQQTKIVNKQTNKQTN